MVPEQNQGKRKMPERNENCDICGCNFVNQAGLKTHKKRMHAVQIPKAANSNSVTLQRCESVKSPPPKKIFFAPKTSPVLLAIELHETNVKPVEKVEELKDSESFKDVQADEPKPAPVEESRTSQVEVLHACQPKQREESNLSVVRSSQPALIPALC